MKESDSIGQLGEVRRGYKVMLAGALLIALAMPTLSIYALPYFMASLSAEFGWQRQEMGVAVSFLALTMFLGGPWAGRLIDRFGGRRIAGISIVLYALGLAALSQLTASLWTLYAGYVALAVLGLGASHICYLRMVATWFGKARGIALGVAGAGAGLMAALLPHFLPQWIEVHGWRAGWLLLAGLSLLAAPIMWLWLRERHERTDASAAATPVLKGLTMAQVSRTRAFWLMITGIFALGVGLVGLTVQLVPLITETTGSRQAATLAGSLFGVGLMCGRLFTGFFLDRFAARAVSATMYSLPVLAIIIFSSGHPYGPAILGLGLGLAAGSENDILSYLVSRYFGLRSFSEVFGWMFGTLSLGAAVGPLLISLLHVNGWGTNSALVVSGVLCLLATCLYALLGHYPPLDATDELELA